MGLLSDLLGLFVNGAYLSVRLLPEKLDDMRYNTQRKASQLASNAAHAFLDSKNTEKIVRSFVADTRNTEMMYELLAEELKYIFNGKPLVLTELQTIDLMMSKFGKLSGGTIDGLSSLGSLNKVYGNMDNYDVSVRVFQCIESNLRAATGREFLFEVKNDAHCCGGKYCNQRMHIADTLPFGGRRVYESVSIPFSPLVTEDLSIRDDAFKIKSAYVSQMCQVINRHVNRDSLH